ncbi:MAG: hypothetical protein AVDCRST_MAG01-01-5266, partial [uncultured Rubrobacteraceae bacterium]
VYVRAILGPPLPGGRGPLPRAGRRPRRLARPQAPGERTAPGGTPAGPRAPGAIVVGPMSRAV